MFSIYCKNHPSTEQLPAQSSTQDTPLFSDHPEINALPLKILVRIFSFLGKLSSLASAALTCKLWKSIVYHPQISPFSQVIRLKAPLATDASTRQIVVLPPLPPEMLQYIFSFLPNPSDFLSTALTCREWKNAIYGMRVDYLGQFFDVRNKVDISRQHPHNFRSFFEWAPYSCLLSIFNTRVLAGDEKSSYLFQSFEKFQMSYAAFREEMHLSNTRGKAYALPKGGCGNVEAQTFVVYTGELQTLCYYSPEAPRYVFQMHRSVGSIVGIKKAEGKFHIVTQYNDFIYDLNEKTLERNTEFSLISQIKALIIKDSFGRHVDFRHVEIVKVNYTEQSLQVYVEYTEKVGYLGFSFIFSSEKGCLEKLQLSGSSFEREKGEYTFIDCPQTETHQFFASVVHDYSSVVVFNKESRTVHDVLTGNNQIVKIQSFQGSDRLIFACKNGDLLTYLCNQRAIEKKSNIFEAMAKNVSVKKEEKVSEPSSGSKKRKQKASQVSEKKRKIEADHTLDNVHFVSETRCLIKWKLGDQAIVSLYDLNSETILQEFDEGVELKIHGMLLVVGNTAFKKEEHLLSVFKFDEKADKLTQIAELYFGNEKASKKSSFLKHTQEGQVKDELLTNVFRASSNQNVNSGECDGIKASLDYEILNESYLAVVIEHKETRSVFCLCSLITGEVQDVYAEMYKDFGDNDDDGYYEEKKLAYNSLLNTCKIAHHHLVFFHPNAEEKKLCIYNLLTGKMDRFDVNRVRPNKNATFHSFKIIEKDKEHCILVTLTPLLPNSKEKNFEFVEISLGSSDFKIRPITTSAQPKTEMDIEKELEIEKEGMEVEYSDY